MLPKKTALVLAAILVVMPLSIATAGTYSGGSGTADNPYLLSRAADWLELSETQSD